MSDINIIQDIYAEVKSWQTGLGALIGMGSLAFVAWYNFHLNRKRDRAQREAEAHSAVRASKSPVVSVLVPAAQLWSDGCFGTVPGAQKAQIRALNCR